MRRKLGRMARLGKPVNQEKVDVVIQVGVVCGHC